MDIDGWLGRIGLAQYAEMFRANDIDGELLGRLTNDDLKDIGVASFGHRKKLLEAIAELGGAPAATPAPRPVVQAPVPATVAPPPTSISVEAAGERRYLTVMFCDLVGSTGISAQLDAEEWRDLVGAYLDAASAAVDRNGRSCRQEARRRAHVRCSAIRSRTRTTPNARRGRRCRSSARLAELNRKNAGTAKPELVARIGLESGPAVVDAAGEIYGDVANIAARVQALAEPGAVLVTAQVQRQIAGLFVAEERGTHALKGVPEPTALFRLVRASGGGRRSGQRNLTPLVGRDDEMPMLMRRWERARQGDGQLVLIVGEPGLGKSRLIEEFHAAALRHPAYLGRMELLAASAEHAAASDRRMGPAALRRRRRAGGAAAGRTGKLAGAGQARPGRERCRCSRRSLIFRCLRNAFRHWRPRNCAAGN